METKDIKKTVKSKRKWWFRLLKKIMKIRYKRPQFIYIGEEISNGGVILSNHEGTDAPMSFEIYGDIPVRFWGAYQMNSGLIKMYKYQSKVYFHQKKHWNLFSARAFCLIASPLTNIFYKGLNLISTYPDARFIKTIRESISAIRKILPNNMYCIQNDAIKLGEYIICGSRGWTVPEDTFKTSQDEKIFNREAIRLEIALQSAKLLQTLQVTQLKITSKWVSL